MFYKHAAKVRRKLQPYKKFPTEVTIFMFCSHITRMAFENMDKSSVKCDNHPFFSLRYSRGEQPITCLKRREK